MKSGDVRPPRAFISYTQETDEHNDRVLLFTDRLRDDGIDASLDQYEDAFPEGLPRWMERQIREADFVLMICTPTYFRRVIGQEEAGKGRGARWEGSLIFQHIYNADTTNTKFIPLLLDDTATPSDIPTPLQSARYYKPYLEADYEKLYRRLTDQPFIPKPELGRLRKLPQRDRKSGSSVESGSSEPDKPWNVPQQRNVFFTGRAEMLQAVREALANGGGAPAAGIQAIYGLGGIGKTQVALEYAYRYRDDYSAVLWLDSDTDASLSASLDAIARLLDLPNTDSENGADAVRAVNRWLENNSGWLLIFDNADRPELLRRFLPRNVRGHILLTSRAQVFDMLGIIKPIELDRLSRDEALQFLLRRTGRDADDTAEQEAALQLADDVGYLPLALEQAGAFITARQSRFQDYLASYRRRRLSLLNAATPVTGDYPKSVATTWAINFQEVVAESESAADLLRFSAFVSPDGIPFELRAEGAAELSPVLCDELAYAAADPLVLDTLLEPLLRYSLVRWDLKTRAFSIHRLVQEVIQDEMTIGTRKMWAERAIRALARVFPDSEQLANWRQCARFIAHVQMAAYQADQCNFTFPEVSFLLRRAGVYLKHQGQYAAAEPLLERALVIREQALGPDHADVAESLNDLAELHYETHRYDAAEPLCERALTIRERILDSDHPDIGQLLHNLGTLQHHRYQYTTAEPLLERALAIRERALGPDHPDIAETLNNLGTLYQDRGWYGRAEPLLERALAIRERALGPDHPDVAESLNNLGTLYQGRYQYAAAQLLLERALAIQERALRPDHPNLVRALNNLGSLYRDRRQHAAAQALQERALTIGERVLGPDHPNLAMVFNNLGNLCRDRQQYARAESYYRQALTILEHANDPQLAVALNNLGDLYQDRGWYGRAEPLLERALAIWEEALGLDHPDVAAALSRLARLYTKQWRYAAAEPLFKQALAIRERTLGPDHPDVAQSLTDLLATYTKQGKSSESADLSRRLQSVNSGRKNRLLRLQGR